MKDTSKLSCGVLYMYLCDKIIMQLKRLAVVIIRSAITVLCKIVKQGRKNTKTFAVYRLTWLVALWI